MFKKNFYKPYPGTNEKDSKGHIDHGYQYDVVNGFHKRLLGFLPSLYKREGRKE